MNMTRIAVCMATVAALGGCTTAGTEQPIGAATSAAPPAAGASPSAGALMDADVVFGENENMVWRESAGPGSHGNKDASMKPGSYRLQVACRGGKLAITVNGADAGAVDCATQQPSIPICLKKPGLMVTAEGQASDMVWQVIRYPTKC